MNGIYIPNVIEEVPQMKNKLDNYESLVGMYGHSFGDKMLSMINQIHLPSGLLGVDGIVPDGIKNIPGYKNESGKVYNERGDITKINIDGLKKTLDTLSLPSDSSLFAYKGTEMMKQLAHTLGLCYNYENNDVVYYGNKSNLYDIFPHNLLPQKYKSEDIKNLSSDDFLIIKENNNASGLGVKKCKVGGIKEYLQSKNLTDNDVIIQEYVAISGEYSLTFETNIQGTPIPIFASEQKIKENDNGTFTYTQGVFDSSQSDKIYDFAQPIIDIIQKKQIGIPVFGVDFVKTASGELKIMEINARTPGSFITANILRHEGYMDNEYNYTRSGIFTRKPVEAFQNGSTTPKKNDYEKQIMLPFKQSLLYTLQEDATEETIPHSNK